MAELGQLGFLSEGDNAVICRAEMPSESGAASDSVSRGTVTEKKEKQEVRERHAGSVGVAPTLKKSCAERYIL